jgi:hypothetical protein
MAKIIPFPQASETVSKIVDEILETKLNHRNPQVLRCLKKELQGLVTRFFVAEEFSATLILPPDLSDEQFHTIERNMQRIFQQHNDQLVSRTNALFLELCLSRMAICELKQQNSVPQQQ